MSKNNFDHKQQLGKSKAADLPGVETTFEKLLQTARQMEVFKNYTDFELNEKLLELFFSSGGTVELESIQPDPEQIIAQLEKQLKEKKPEDHFIEFKTKIFERKKSLMETMKEEFSPTYDNHSIHYLLVKMANSIDAYRNDVYWNFNLYRDKDFIRFKKETANTYYILNTSFCIKIWDTLAGQKNERLEQFDLFRYIPIYPKETWKPIYGTNFFQSRAVDDSWVALCFGTTNTPKKFIALEETSKYSINALVLYLSNTFDDIFNWIHLRSPNDKDKNIDKSNVNEGLLFKFVSESFLPVIKLFSAIDHIAYSTPLNENHPFQAVHIVYFIAWLYINWIPFLEKTLHEEKSYVTPDGETGVLSLNQVFERIRHEAEEELIGVNFEENLDSFYAHFAENETMLQKIDFYTGLIPELKRRTKTLLSTLLGDITRDYLLQKKYYLQYRVDERANLVFSSMVKGEQDSFINKLLSAFKPSEIQDEPTVLPITASEEETETTETPQAVGVISYSIQKDYSSYSRTLDELLAILSNISTTLNANFSNENRFMQTHLMKPNERYTYLKANPFYTLNEDVSIDQVVGLQDCYDAIFKTISQGKDILQGIKNKEIPRVILQKKNDFNSNMEELDTLFKDTSSTLGLLTQDKAQYDHYVLFLNKFKIIYDELLKIKN